MKRHLKRMMAPKTWKILRKRNTFIARPQPGAHSLKTGMPIVIVLRDYLKQAQTMREAKHILSIGAVLVDGKKISNIRHMVGLMDLIAVGNDHYRMIVNTKGQLSIINAKEKDTKPKKIANKTKYKGQTQINFFDGTNMLVTEDKYKPGDTLLIEFPGRISAHYALAAGATVYLTGGKHKGQQGTVESIEKSGIMCKTSTGKHIVQKMHVFVIGDSVPCITLTQ
ncbi:MAG: KOW motif-containing protein [Candidatus Woesearchaeota archaeon]